MVIIPSVVTSLNCTFDWTTTSSRTLDSKIRLRDLEGVRLLDDICSQGKNGTGSGEDIR